MSLMRPFDFQLRTRLIFGEGTFERMGEFAAQLGFKRCLVVSDPGIASCGYVERALKVLAESGITSFTYTDFTSNPDSSMVQRGCDFAAPLHIDSLIGLGGGSSMDSAKAINFLITNGGSMSDYQGWAKARKPLLPMIGVPTSAGTGSEAQSYALISDSRTHAKMACGDPGAAFRIAILDPLLTVTQPPRVTATSGIDAIGHALESYVTSKRNPLSEIVSLEAWRLLLPNYERVVRQPSDVQARGAMQLGAYWAGLAIENSMLGAAHACANPLTAHFNTDHGIAVGLMLPHVIRWNSAAVADRYAALAREVSIETADGNPGDALARRVEELLQIGHLPRTLREADIHDPDFQTLGAEAAEQWTGKCNPRPFGKDDALELYRRAY